MRAFLKFLINIALIGAVIWLVVRFTTLDDKIIEFFTKKSPTTVSCSTPRGATIPNGASIFAYETANAGDGECKEEARTCKNGTLEGTYTYQACSNNASNTGSMNQTGDGGTDTGISAVGASCDTPRGQSIEHGNYIVAYESPSSCTFQRRMCVDGKLLGKFMYNYCIIAFNGGSNSAGIATYNSPYSVDNAFAGGYPQNGNANLNGMTPDQFSNAVNGQAAIYNSNISLTSPYTNQGSWQYTPVNYGGNIANQQLPDDYWNQNTNGNTSFIRSRSDNKTNPSATQGYPGNYNGVRDWNYNNYDLTQKGCKSPWGSFVENGQYVIAYKTSAPSTRNGSCEYERRTCFNGQLNGSFGYASCSMPGKVSNSATRQYGNQGYDNYYRDSEPTYTNNSRSCRTPRGAYIANGDYVRAYKYGAAPWANGCEGEIRYCRNGVLDGSYGNRTCTLKTPPYPGCYGWECSHTNRTNNRNNSCNLPRGGTIYNGQSVVAYNGLYGSCYSERRTCINGRLNGSYTSQYCSNNNTNYNSCYLPRGGYISDGQSVRAYRIGYNGDCISENRYCSNGNLQGSYSMQSCSNNNQSCTLPWGGSISDGQAVEAYASSSGPCLKESRQCRNGTLYGSYDYQSCYLQPTSATDQYGDWQDMGRFDNVPNNSDTCSSDAIATFSCQSQDQTTCTDYRKVATECCGGTRGRYERRTVTCNR